MWTSQFCAKVITLYSLPQTSFGVRLSRIQCVTNEPQRTCAGRLNFIVLYPYTKCSCKKTSNKLHQGVLTKIIFLGDFLACIALKLEKISPTSVQISQSMSRSSHCGSCPCQSLPSVATDNREKFHCLNKALN